MPAVPRGHRAGPHGRSATGAPELAKLRHFFDHPGFVAANADAVRAARDTLPAALRDAARLVFTAHSVPIAADAAAGTPADGGHRYSRAAAEAARLVAAELGRPSYDLVWQSRSGPPQVPWLEPDINDHLDTLAAAGVPGRGRRTGRVRLRPRRGDLGPRHRGPRARRRSWASRSPGRRRPGPDPRFADMVVELVAEHTARAPRRAALSADVPSAGCTVNGLPCAVDCCAPTRRPAGR